MDTRSSDQEDSSATDGSLSDEVFEDSITDNTITVHLDSGFDMSSTPATRSSAGAGLDRTQPISAPISYEHSPVTFTNRCVCTVAGGTDSAYAPNSLGTCKCCGKSKPISTSKPETGQPRQPTDHPQRPTDGKAKTTTVNATTQEYRLSTTARDDQPARAAVHIPVQITNVATPHGRPSVPPADAGASTTIPAVHTVPTTNTSTARLSVAADGGNTVGKFVARRPTALGLPPFSILLNKPISPTINATTDGATDNGPTADSRGGDTTPDGAYMGNFDMHTDFTPLTNKNVKAMNNFMDEAQHGRKRQFQDPPPTAPNPSNASTDSVSSDDSFMVGDPTPLEKTRKKLKASRDETAEALQLNNTFRSKLMHTVMDAHMREAELTRQAEKLQDESTRHNSTAIRRLAEICDMERSHETEVRHLRSEISRAAKEAEDSVWAAEEAEEKARTLEAQNRSFAETTLRQLTELRQSNNSESGEHTPTRDSPEPKRAKLSDSPVQDGASQPTGSQAKKSPDGSDDESDKKQTTPTKTLPVASATVSGPIPPSTPRKRKDVQISKWSPTDDIPWDDYLSYFEVMCKQNNYSGEDRTGWLYAVVKGKAQAHLMSHPGSTYEELITILTEKFGSAKNRTRSARKYFDVVWDGKETADDYSTRLMRAARQAYPSRETKDFELSLIHQFEQGLKSYPEVMDAVFMDKGDFDSKIEVMDKWLMQHPTGSFKTARASVKVATQSTPATPEPAKTSSNNEEKLLLEMIGMMKTITTQKQQIPKKNPMNPPRNPPNTGAADQTSGQKRGRPIRCFACKKVGHRYDVCRSNPGYQPTPEEQVRIDGYNKYMANRSPGTPATQKPATTTTSTTVQSN